ncbi:hypothetical protein K525DRAFT_274697 [Schizophyllum commune Loenen D]|nr:hypothetical protein K525DRAFT_274697 [Schizophyllum commune Loenen D]
MQSDAPSLERQEVVRDTAKRKRKTGIIKTWLGTDPSKSAPQVDYGNEQAAARAEKKKKRKLEAQQRKEAASRAGESAASVTHAISNPWALPPENNYTDGGPMEMLMRFDKEDQAVVFEAGVPDANGFLHSNKWAPDVNQALPTDAAPRPTHRAQLTADYPPLHTSSAMDCDQAVSINAEGFNTDWRRFGPQGRDITGYVQQPEDVPTVVWPTDLKTILPFVPDEGSVDKGKNIIAWVNAAKRELDSQNPYVTASLEDFATWLNAPDKVRCILDLVCSFPQGDKMTDRIADNVVQSIATTYGNKYRGHFAIVADMLRTQDWFLLHTGGFFSFGHIDASGMATSAEIRGGGMKQWVVFVCRNMPKAPPNASGDERRRMHGELLTRLCDLLHAASTDDLLPPSHRSTPSSAQLSDGPLAQKATPAQKSRSSARGKGASANQATQQLGGVVKEGGDAPSGTVHAAYTPVPTAAAGKHFFTYDDLHRVEVARRVQMQKRRVTNHNHNLFYRKPMIALALMLLRPDEYIPEPPKLHKVSVGAARYTVRARETSAHAKKRWEAEDEMRKENKERQAEFDMTTRLRSPDWSTAGTSFDRLAHIVAGRILRACLVRYPGDDAAHVPGPEYILEGEDWTDPGPVLNLKSRMDDIIHTNVDELRRGKDARNPDDDTEGGDEGEDEGGSGSG